MLLFFVTWVRFTEHGPPSQSLAFVTRESLASLVRGSEYCIVFFPDQNGSSFEFANYGMSRYPSIKFAVATYEDGKSFDVPFYPYAIGFVRGVRFNQRVIQRPAAFARFCNDMVQSTSSVVNLINLEQVRLILDGDDSVLLSVGECRVPRSCKRGDVVHCVQPNLLEYFGVNVTGGYYVYRGQDRQLVPVAESNYKRYMKTFVQSARSADLVSRQFFAGYFMNERDPAENEKELAILSKLSQNPELRNSFNIGPISGPISVIFSQTAHVDFVRLPLFLVITTLENSPTHRWVVIDDDLVHNVEYLSGLLTRIAGGTEPPTVLSSPINATDPMSINHDKYWELIESHKGPSVVALVGMFGNANQLIPDVFRGAHDILGDKVRFYIFNASTNDIPSGVDVVDLPAINYYHDTRRPLQYAGEITVDSIVNWIKNVAEMPLHPESEL